MKSLFETPDLTVKNKKVCALTWFNSTEVLDLYEKQQEIFNHFKLTINTYFDKSLSHAKFMDHCLENIISTTT